VDPISLLIFISHLLLFHLLLVLIFYRIVLTNIMYIPTKEPTYILAAILCMMTHQQIGNMITSLFIIILVPFVFTIPLSFVFYRTSFGHNRRGRLFFMKRRMMRT